MISGFFCVPCDKLVSITDVEELIKGSIPQLKLADNDTESLTAIINLHMQLHHESEV
jgi:hypothetical protein